MDSYSFTHSGVRYVVDLTGIRTEDQSPPPPDLAGCAEILRLAEENQRLARENGGIRALGRLNAALVEERDALKCAVDEAVEVEAEICAALAVLAGESLIPCGDGKTCPGHFGEKTQAAFTASLAAWRALQEGNRQAIERIGELERLLETKPWRLLSATLQAHRNDSEIDVADTLRRIIRERTAFAVERDGYKANLKSVLAANEGIESENRSKCLELAEMAEEVRELRRECDEAQQSLGLLRQGVDTALANVREWQAGVPSGGT